MKRFFPLLLGLSLIFCAFTNANATTPNLEEEWPTEPFTVEVNFEMATPDDMASAVSLIKICRFGHAFSQGQNCSPSSAEMVVNPVTCKGEVSAFLTVTNLVPPNSQNIPAGPHQLPSGVPEMSFEYSTFGTSRTISSIDDFYYSGEDKKDSNGDLYHLFEKELIMEFDVSQLCPGQAISIIFDARVKDDNNQNYDITTHVGQTDIWYCEIFDESCSFCAPPGGCALNPLSGQELVWTNREACAEFCFCNPIIKTANESNDPEALDGKTFTIDSGAPLNMETSPNPFTNEVRLNFNHKVDVITSLQIVDMTGRAYINDSNLHIHSSSYALNTFDIPAGVYFCKVLVDGKVMSKKIIKM